jgi:hypothetical protein
VGEKPKQKVLLGLHLPPILIGNGGFLWPEISGEKPKRHTMNTLEKPSIRVLAHNPDHHLWNNHGTWWCH